MKNPKIMMVILTGLLSVATQGFAQNFFQVTVKGTSVTTNDSGAIVSTKLSNKSYIQDAATGLGRTNSSGLTLVYVQNASTDPGTPGDFLEVVDTNGAPVYTNLLFLYGGSFPPPLISADQSQFAMGAGVVPLPLAGSGESLGGATINGKIMPKKTLINGSFNYTTLRSPASTSNDVVQAVSGTFSVNKVFTPK